MSEQNPYDKLGVTENATFEEILEAKKRLSQMYQEDSKALQSIDAAYDAIIMDRLKMRQEGKIKVPDRIRFAEKVVEAPTPTVPKTTNTPPAWLTRLIDTPSMPDLIWPAGVFLLLAIITIFTQGSQESFLSLLMALGFGGNIYFLTRKEGRFGRALVITLIAICLGVVLGSQIANLINGQNTGIILSSGEFATLFTFFLFWLISSFLR